MDELNINEFANRDPEVEKLRRELSRAKRTNADLKKSREILQKEVDELEGALDLRDATQDISPIKIKPRQKKDKNEACAVLCLSDTHIGELVEPRTVNGRNSYNPEIAKASIELFFQNSLRLIEAQRATVRIEDAVLWLGGDIITGYIHEELMEGNPLSPTEEILLAQDLISGGIDFLLENAKIKNLLIPCNYGNHGRTTHKRRIATGARNSFEWLLYKNLEAKYQRIDGVQFVVADGEHLYVDVFDTRLRLHHGDAVRYHGGVGGLSIPLRKAVDAWDDFRPADLTIIGHYHQRVDYGFAVVNGSTKGYDPFALHVKARFEEPQQAFLLVDKHHGKTISAPVFVRGKM